MKNRLVIFLLLFCVIYSFAQGEINPNGYNIIKYPNGKKLSEGYIQNSNHSFSPSNSLSFL